MVIIILISTIWISSYHRNERSVRICTYHHASTIPTVAETKGWTRIPGACSCSLGDEQMAVREANGPGRGGDVRARSPRPSRRRAWRAGTTDRMRSGQDDSCSGLGLGGCMSSALLCSLFGLCYCYPSSPCLEIREHMHMDMPDPLPPTLL